MLEFYVFHYLSVQMNQITIIELQGVDDSEDYLINVPFANPNKHKRLKNPDD